MDKEKTCTIAMSGKKLFSSVAYLVLFMAYFLYVTIEKLTLGVLFRSRYLRHKIMRQVNKATQMDRTDFQLDDWSLALVTRHAIVTKTEYLCQTWFTKVHTGSQPYDVTVFKLDGSRASIMDFYKEGRPLVLNFGSCT